MKNEIIDQAWEHLNKINVDADGNYVKYSNMEERFDGLTEMSEQLNELHNMLAETQMRITKAKTAINKKLITGDFKVNNYDRHNWFHDVEDVRMDVNYYANELVNNMEGSWFKFFQTHDSLSLNIFVQINCISLFKGDNCLFNQFSSLK